MVIIMKILNNLSTPHPLKNKKTIFLLYISCIFLFNFITMSCGSSSENDTTAPPMTQDPDPMTPDPPDTTIPAPPDTTIPAPDPTTPAPDLNPTDVDDDDNRLIEIRTLEQLNMIRNDLTGASLHDGTVGDSMGCPPSGCNGYELVNSLRFDSGDDFDDSGAGNFLPIGGNTTNQFTAIFDGNGHTIINLNIQRNSTHVGLFGDVGSSGIIRNIGLVDNTSTYIGTSDDTNYVGGLVGVNSNNGTITASYSTGNVNGSTGNTDIVGGLVGRNDGGTITASYSTGNADGRTGDRDIVGGLVGRNDGGTITASYSTGNADGGAGDTDFAGGLVGRNDGGTITASYSTGDADGRTGNGDFVGGLVGVNSNSGTITASYSTGDADGGAGNTDLVGGLVGLNSNRGTITASYSTGDADGGTGNTDSVGGLVGANQAMIIASYGFGALAAGTAGSVGTAKPTGVTTASDLTAANAGVAWNEAVRNTLNAWSFGSGAPKLKYADYDGSTSATYNCDMFPASVTCGTTLIPGQ